MSRLSGRVNDSADMGRENGSEVVDAVGLWTGPNVDVGLGPGPNCELDELNDLVVVGL